jgi:hypothetical protein
MKNQPSGWFFFVWPMSRGDPVAQERPLAMFQATFQSHGRLEKRSAFHHNATCGQVPVR